MQPGSESRLGLASDCETLLAVVDILSGGADLNWSESVPIAEWDGVETGRSPNRVTRLNLRERGLRGAIPPQLSRLDRLETLDLGLNSLTGSIPPELGALRSLMELYLQHNRLTGAIPAVFGRLTSLQVLDLGANRLTGEIPAELGGLSNLRSFFVGVNFLTGDVPGALAGLPNLANMDIAYNHLTGCVPDDLSDVRINLGTMRFCRDFPEVWSHRPVFDGGVDLGITYIERQPRFPRYKLAYFTNGDCPYPFDEFRGAVVCPEQAGIKRWPDPGEIVQLTAHVWNFGDSPSGSFDYAWIVDNNTIEEDQHDGLESGGSTEFMLSVAWPNSESNPTVTFVLDPENRVEELIEANNVVVDWMKGYTLAFSFTPSVYENLRLPNRAGQSIYSPEHWVHRHVSRLNELLMEAGLEDRVRAELLLISDEPHIGNMHPLRSYMDGWWPLWGDKPIYTEGSEEQPVIDFALLHELMHQLGVIDLYSMDLGPEFIMVPDANRPGQMAGCGTDYWEHEWECFRSPEGIKDLMADLGQPLIGLHTAGGLRSNTGHRRGFFGEYLYDTPQSTSVKVVDHDGRPLPDVTLRFYGRLPSLIVDAEPEFMFTTDDLGIVVLPNRGITGVVTETGHQLRPNPFGVIDVSGSTGIFIVAMEGPCTNYEWLTIVDLNLAYWEGHTDEAVIAKTLRCPPPRQGSVPLG